MKSKRPQALKYQYQTLELSETVVHLRTLRDNQQFSDPEGVAETLGVPPAGWSHFGLLWDSSKVLARLMQGFDVTGCRVLEVGCGVGLSSLILSGRQSDITATDHHPDAQRHLQWNVELNNLRSIPFFRTGWDDGPSALGRFDLIIGSDLLYQPDHPALLSTFIEDHARSACQVILVDPRRGYMNQFGRLMLGHGFDETPIEGSPYSLEDETPGCRIGSYLRS